MAKEVITLAGMMNFFKDDTTCISKGELKYKADFVLDLRIDSYNIRAQVRASMKDKSYKTVLDVDGEGNIAGGRCECPRGNWLCSHMAAVAIYAHKKGLSKTDLPNTWLARPRKAARLDVKSFSDFFPSPKPEYSAITRAVTEDDRKFLYDGLSETGTMCGLQWICGPEPQLPADAACAPVLIEDILQDFANDPNTFVRKCYVSSEQIQWLASKTKDQRNSQAWGSFRRLRLTGSNFGDVVRAMANKRDKDKPIPNSLLKKLRGEYSLGTKDSIMWGQMHEQIAIERYQQTTGNKVQPAGLYLFPCGLLGSTPDGIIEDSCDGVIGIGVLEVKCPWNYRESTITQMLSKELKGKEEESFYLKSNRTLNEHHSYWHQVQAEMHAVGTEWVHFVVWTTVDIEIILVKRDPNWEELYLPMLKSFYLSELLPSVYIKED